MRRNVGLIALAVLLVGCGSSSKGGSHGDEPPGNERGQAWCPDLDHIVSTNERDDLTGKANTYDRVRRIHGRYARTILKRCPGVVSVGVSTLSVLERRARGPVSPEDTDYVLSIGLLSGRYRPERTLFLDGVPLRFEVTGRPHPV